MNRPVANHGKPTVPFFVKGPLDWGWICAAGRLPGRALHVAVALFLLMGLRKSTTVKLGRVRLAEIGVKRHSGYRALQALENANLVSVVRQRGAAPIVTMRPTAGGDKGGSAEVVGRHG